MYKLVAIDLDGTMLNHYGEISEKTKEMILSDQQGWRWCCYNGGKPTEKEAISGAHFPCLFAGKGNGYAVIRQFWQFFKII